MRSFLLTAATFGVLLTWGCPARADDTPREVIDKALKAHGGKERLAKLKSLAVQAKLQGTLRQPVEVALTTETFAQEGKFKSVTEITFMGQNISQAQGYDGENFWITINGMEYKLDDKAIAEIKEQLYAEQVVDMSFFKGEGYELSPLGEVKVEDKPAIGIRVSTKGHRDLNLFFDKESGLLVKTESRVLDILSKQEVTEEKVLSDYKKFDELMRPSKISIYHDGKKVIDLEVAEVKIVDKFDASLFTKP
jgi:hypothetical protein